MQFWANVSNPRHDVSEFIMFYLFGFTLFQVVLFCLCVCSLSSFQARSLSEEFLCVCVGGGGGPAN